MGPKIMGPNSLIFKVHQSIRPFGTLPSTPHDLTVRDLTRAAGTAFPSQRPYKGAILLLPKSCTDVFNSVDQRRKSRQRWSITLDTPRLGANRLAGRRVSMGQRVCRRRRRSYSS